MSIFHAFESESRVRQLLRNVTDRLKPDGFFVVTTVDVNVVLRKIRAVNDLQISTCIYRIQSDDDHANKRFPVGNPYDNRYLFTLDENVKDCQEFLVHFPSCVKVAAEYHLTPIMACNFHDFFTEFSNDASCAHYRQLLFSKHVVNNHGRISADEWDAIYLYIALAIKKNRDSKSPTSIPSKDTSSIVRKHWPPIDPDEIIDMHA